jgi:23S rRNA (cytidine1920-2'-O)/16S rRNA (cytidine1409-2'-O)-methyltransferase
MKIKRRLDVVLAEKYPHLSRTMIQSFIMQGNARVNGQKNTKAGAQVEEIDEVVLIIEEQKYVSRGGFKLEAALEHFKINIAGMVALDAGISTGGFTDCLLQHGARKVYGIDVGQGQVHEKIRNNSNVILLEKTNLRHLDRLSELVDIVTLDLSFISILKVMPAVVNFLKENGSIVVLIKPQFEAERKDIRRGGIVKEDTVHKKVIEKIITGMQTFSFYCVGVIDSPIFGATSGNKEFLGLFIKNCSENFHN